MIGELHCIKCDYQQREKASFNGEKDSSESYIDSMGKNVNKFMCKLIRYLLTFGEKPSTKYIDNSLFIFQLFKRITCTVLISSSSSSKHGF